MLLASKERQLQINLGINAHALASELIVATRQNGVIILARGKARMLKMSKHIRKPFELSGGIS